MQRYLQYDRLQELGMAHFDCWASRFGETCTSLELAPEGTGYRARTRFSKFFNLPELMNLFNCLLYTSTEGCFSALKMEILSPSQKVISVWWV